MRERDLLDVRKDCYKRQKKAAEKMINVCQDLYPALKVGDEVTMPVPGVDRGPLDFANIRGIILATKDDLYQIGTKNGLLAGWYNRTEMQNCQTSELSADDVPRDRVMTIREAAASQSLTGGQGFKKCMCKSGAKQCRTLRCKCFKAGLECNTKCHSSHSCENKSS